MIYIVKFNTIATFVRQALVYLILFEHWIFVIFYRLAVRQQICLTFCLEFVFFEAQLLLWTVLFHNCWFCLRNKLFCAFFA
jgi:hypothetical protein